MSDSRFIAGIKTSSNVNCFIGLTVSQMFICDPLHRFALIRAALTRSRAGSAKP